LEVRDSQTTKIFFSRPSVANWPDDIPPRPRPDRRHMAGPDWRTLPHPAPPSRRRRLVRPAPSPSVLCAGRGGGEGEGEGEEEEEEECERERERRRIWRAACRRPRRVEEGTVPASKKDEGTASASEEVGTAPAEGVQGGTPARCPAAHQYTSLALWVSVNCFL
jgi:hypothetical protein